MILRKLIAAFGYSLEGLAAATKSEIAFRIELACLLFMAPLAFWFGDSALEIAMLLSSLLLVLIAELINTAIEATINRISEELHPLSKKAKDVGSAVVLLSLIHAGIIWLLIGWP